MERHSTYQVALTLGRNPDREIPDGDRPRTDVASLRLGTTGSLPETSTLRVVRQAYYWKTAANAVHTISCGSADSGRSSSNRASSKPNSRIKPATETRPCSLRSSFARATSS